MVSPLRFRLKIILTLILFLGLAMALSDVVLTLHHQNKQLVSAIRQTRANSALIAGLVSEPWDEMGRRNAIIKTLRQIGLPVMLVDKAGAVWFDSSRSRGRLREKLLSTALLAQHSRHKESLFFHKELTLLGPRYQAFLEACPVVLPTGRIQGSVVALADLRQVSDRLLAGQRIFLLYGLFNLVILAFLAYVRLSHLFIRPLQSLAKRAEEYRDDEDFLFSDLPTNEFTTLSTSLNAMLRRIKSDRATLREMVAELEAANRSLRQAQEEMIRAEKLASVGRLSAGIAHEIGNPLGIVLGYLELLKGDDLEPEQRLDVLNRAMAEIQRINTIIRQLLDLARPGSEDIKTVFLHDLLAEISQAMALQPLLGGMKIIVEAKAEQDGVEIDPEKLRQVLMNRIMNAADACHGMDDARLVITTGNKEGNMVVTVTDNGPGIAPEHINAVFDPFFTTKEPGKGTGLGLSVSYMILEAAGGSLSVRSDKGGTTFTLILPLSTP